MDGGSDDLFVIDKSGDSSSLHKKIIYNFKEDPELGVEPIDVPEPQPLPHRPRKTVSGKRYHEVDDLSGFRPGRISNELREALNLAEHELPTHIYRMRTLGYPPGWLRKARVGEGLTMFNSVYELAENTDVSYNRDALVSYPGFNTKIESPFIDEYEALHCPRMQNHHLLDNFFAALSRSARTNPVGNNPEDGPDEAELSKLWEERERILAEIRQLDAKIHTSHDIAESGDGDRCEVLGKLPSSANPMVSEDCIPTKQDNSQSRVNPDNSNLSIVGVVLNGTPTPTFSIESEGAEASPATGNKRPDVDAFSVGVQPFRPFENLPGSGGSYRRVLETLRNSRDSSSVSISAFDSSQSDVSNLHDSPSKPFSPYTHHDRSGSEKYNTSYAVPTERSHQMRKYR